jgi:hypothetical protein
VRGVEEKGVAQLVKCILASGKLAFYPPITFYTEHMKRREANEVPALRYFL